VTSSNMRKRHRINRERCPIKFHHIKLVGTNAFEEVGHYGMARTARLLMLMMQEQRRGDYGLGEFRPFTISELRDFYEAQPLPKWTIDSLEAKGLEGLIMSGLLIHLGEEAGVDIFEFSFELVALCFASSPDPDFLLGESAPVEA